MTEPATELETTEPEVQRPPVELSLIEWELPWKGVFVRSLSRMPNVSAACRAAGVSRATVYEAREVDERFALAWEEAKEVGLDLMEQEAHRRAMIGIPRRKTTRRVKRGADGAVLEETVTDVDETEISNDLLMGMLKAYRPDRFRERVDHRVSGDPDAPIQHEIVSKTPRTRERLLGLIELAVELGIGPVNGDGREPPLEIPAEEIEP